MPKIDNQDIVISQNTNDTTAKTNLIRTNKKTFKQETIWTRSSLLMELYSQNRVLILPRITPNLALISTRRLSGNRLPYAATAPALLQEAVRE